MFRNTVVQKMNDGNFCIAIGIDTKIAFNFIKWPDILTALKRWDVPQYIYNMFYLYFSGRLGTVSTGNTQGDSLNVDITDKIPQDSVVGPPF